LVVVIIFDGFYPSKI